MYQVLIIDDEKKIADGIGYLVKRGMPECEIQGIAYDGIEGARMAELLHPDIIITDIRMPQMNGLDMISRLRAAQCNAKIIILSGYTEFEYAKSAITLGVQDYITKPVEEKELYQVLKQVCQMIDEEKSKKSEVRYLEQHVKESVLKEVLTVRTYSMEQGIMKLQKAGFETDGKCFVCAIFEIGKDITESVYVSDHLYEAMSLYVSKAEVDVLYFPTDQFLIIFSGDKTLEFAKLAEIICYVKDETAEECQVDINAGIGMKHYGAKGLADSFSEANEALGYKLLKGLGSVTIYDQVKNITTVKIVDESDIQKLEKCIDSLDEEACGQVIDEIFDKILSSEAVNLKSLQMQSLSLILLGIRKVPFIQMQLSETFGENILSPQRIERFDNIEQIKNWIKNTLRSVIDLILRQRVTQKRDSFGEIIDYINNNFDNEVSLSEISKRFYINPYYFSQLFHKKTGETFQNYVIELRVERAKRLLKETELKIHEVCKAVGYQDARYFSRLFERRVGLKPSEYRKY